MNYITSSIQELIEAPCKRKIDKLIIHCAATPEGKHFTVADIDRWHRKRGFNCVGYHFVILLDGTIQVGRAIKEVGAHAGPKYNPTSIGICYIGGCEAIADKNGKYHSKDTRTKEQKEALLQLLCALRKRFPESRIHGHRDFAAKACPSFDATAEFKDL